MLFTNLPVDSEDLVGHHPEGDTGTGVTPVVREINAEVNRIADTFGKANEHFVLIDLPDPMVSVRFQEKVADKGDQAAATEVRMVRRFNELMAALTAHWPPTTFEKPEVSFEDAEAGVPGARSSFGPADVTPVGGADPAKVTLVRMSEWMKRVSDNPETFGLRPLAQRHGPVRYLGVKVDPMPDPGLRRALTTSDLAHPTEAVYELIGRQIVNTVPAKSYRIGKLDAESWPGQRPFPNIPGP